MPIVNKQSIKKVNMSNNFDDGSPKPPIGITPPFIHKQQRIDDIWAAINRYYEAKLPINIGTYPLFGVRNIYTPIKSTLSEVFKQLQKNTIYFSVFFQKVTNFFSQNYEIILIKTDRKSLSINL